MEHTAENSCPGCKTELVTTIGEYDGKLYEGIKCPNGCDLWEFWG